MEIPILSQANVNELFKTIAQNKNWYLSDTGTSFPIHRNNERTLKHTKMSEELFSSLLVDDTISAGENDAKNSYIVFRALQGLTPYQARDERVWCALTHLHCRNYTISRHDLSEKNYEEKVTKHFFARKDGLRGIDRYNAVSRLWWHGYFVDRCRGDHDLADLLEVLCTNTDFRQSMIERPEISKVPQVCLAILNCKKKLDTDSPESKFFSGRGSTAPHRTWFRMLSLAGGQMLFSSMSSQELEDMFWKFIVEVRSQQATDK